MATADTDTTSANVVAIQPLDEASGERTGLREAHGSLTLQAKAGRSGAAPGLQGTSSSKWMRR